jgi:uncharacterized protein (DUF433 family)
MNAPSNHLLETGIYTLPQAAYLVGATLSQVRVWVEGRNGKTAQAPVISNEVGRIGNTVAISFTNLMELRFVAQFNKAGVRLNNIRAIMEEVRDVLNHPHPFSTKTVFKTDGKKIVAQIIGKNGFQAVYDLRSRNYEMPIVVLQSLREDVIWDPDGDAIAWFPRKKLAPNVIIHPKFAFGKPILRKSGIPTETIAQAVKAERSQKAVANIYEIPVSQVREAVSFEKHLRMAA